MKAEGSNKYQLLYIGHKLQKISPLFSLENNYICCMKITAISLHIYVYIVNISRCVIVSELSPQ